MTRNNRQNYLPVGQFLTSAIPGRDISAQELRSTPSGPSPSVYISPRSGSRFQSPTAAKLLAIIAVLTSGAGASAAFRISVLPLMAGSWNFMFGEAVPNTNGDVVCMAALKGGPAFSSPRAKEAGTEVSEAMVKERREDACGKSEGAWSALFEIVWQHGCGLNGAPGAG